MADIISRLKLESGEFDSKVQRAVGGLKQMEKECRNVGGTLAVLEKDQKEYVQSLGQMQTVSTSVRGKISELTNAYTELRAQYNRLTDEEKKGDFGKALSSSLDQLKGRIKDSKGELQNITSELNGGFAGALDGLAGKFGFSISQLTGWGSAIAAAKVALDVAKDAFFATEGNIDEWGRTVEGAKGAYNVFLDTLNNGNWSNFFSNLTTAVTGARDLYDALDRLGSIKSNNQAAIAILQEQLQTLRLQKQEGKDVDAQITQTTKKLQKLRGQSVDAGKNAGISSMTETIRNSINSMGGGVSNDAIQRAIQGILTKGQAEFDKYAQTVSKFENWSQAKKTITRSDMDGNSWTEKRFDINLLNEEQQRQYKIAKAITDKETTIQEGISIYAQAVQEGANIAREAFKGNRYALQENSSSGGTNKASGWAPIAMGDMTMVPVGKSLNDIDAKLKRATSGYMSATDVNSRQEYRGQMDSLTAERNRMVQSATGMFDDAYRHDFAKDIETLKKNGNEKEDDGKKESQTAQLMEQVGQIATGMDSVVGGLESLGIELPKGFKNAISAVQSLISIASGIMSVVTAIQSITAMNTVIPLASGGVVHAASGFMVPGTHFSGDLVPAMLNSGETVLNKAQTGNLASQLSQAERMQSGVGGSYVSGEMIMLGTNNHLSRTGQGELVTTRMLRNYGLI